MRLPLPALALAVFLPGCSLIPDYLRPASPVQAGWPEGPAYRRPPAQPEASLAATADAIGWRDLLADPRLQQTVQIALAENRNLRIAVLNVAAAEAQFRSQRGDLFRRLGATGALDASRTPDVASPFGSGGGTGGTTSRLYSAGVGFSSYEIDLFGRVRSLSAQAFQRYLGYAETRRSTQISLVGQVANIWLAVAADQDLLALTRQTLANQEDAYRLTRAGFEGGNATELALRQAQTAVETARANLALYTRQMAQDINALNLAVGATVPEGLLPAEGLARAAAPVPEAVPEGLRSDLLLRRPDVLAAERNLLAAQASIGAARAAFFPSITLTSNYGTASRGLSGLFGAGSSAWTFAPQVNIPIFNAGVNRANLDLAKLQRDVQVAEYERTIQTAFREVADALAARGTYDDQIAAQTRLVEAYADAYRLALLRFRGGLDTFQAPLDSQRQLYAAQQQLITLRLARMQNLVTLYKALGGGWYDTTAVAVVP